MTVTRREIPKPANAPPPRERIKNALQAARRVITAAVNREPIKRTPEEREAALAICQACEKWRGTTCGLCGCVGRWKTWLETESCPLGRW